MPSNQEPHPTPQLVEIRKYSNRRYYDATRSRHLTLEQIRALVQEGCDIRVIDSRSSADITAKVLTQIILELDETKLELFPTGLLTELVRINDGLMSGFFERFLNQTFEMFMDYQKRLTAQMKSAGDWSSFLLPLESWTKLFAQPLAARKAGETATAVPPPDLVANLEDLRQRMKSLEGELAARGERRKRARKKV